jgi:Tol biopolymer transport system component
MSPERKQKIEALYHAARDPVKRASVLGNIDPDLRREVEALLERDQEGVTHSLVGANGQLGPYKIEAPLGAGGMGEVFRATDTRLHRNVAIKILLRDKIADSERRQRFMQEARAASALNHPNIVTLFDIANDSGTDYLVMEYVPGKSLDKCIGAKGLPLVEAIGYATQIASALGAAHAAGIVHRDIKPANVIVTPDGQVKVLDFGLAKLAERENAETLTAAGSIMGTAAYMSPEQASGLPLDHRTDIFSLGVMLYEMLTGSRPFRGKSQAETMSAIINDPAPPLRTSGHRLEEILDKALEKDPKERYQSASDLAVDLRRVNKILPLASVAPASNQPRPWLAIAGATLALAAATVGWFAVRPTGSADNPLAGAQYTRITDFPGDETDAAISRDGKFVAFRSDRDGPVDTFVSQIGSGRFVNLTHGKQDSVFIRHVGFTPDGSEIWLAGIIGGTRLRLMPLTGGTTRAFLTEHAINLSWSPDASRIVFHTYDTGDPMFVSDGTGGNARQIFTLGAGGHNHFPTWSPDGQWIYFVSGMWDAREMDLFRIRPIGGTPERLTHHNSDLRYVAALDNRTILYVAPDQNGAGPWLWALDTERKVSRRVTSGLEIYESVEASADGRRLVATVSNPTANLWSVPLLDRPAEERDIKPFNLPTVRAWGPRYGRTALFYLSSRGGGDGLWRYEDGQATEIWRGADGALLEPAAVSFADRRVAVILRKQGKRTLNILSAEGGDIRPLAPTIDVSSSASWSPDGKWIVVGGGDKERSGLFKIPVDGGQPVRLTKGVALNPVWSSDGSLIVYTGPAVGNTGPLLMVGPDGSPVEAPPIQLHVGGARYRFVPGRRELVYMPGSGGSPRDFWLVDFNTGKTRRLSNFDTPTTRTFDITPDGKQIVFDRSKGNSDIVLIDLPGRNK